VDSWPSSGLKRRLESFCINDGGLIGTAWWLLHRLGGKASVCREIRNSEMSKRAVEAFTKEGVDASFIVRSENAEPVMSIVIADTSCGARTIYSGQKRCAVSLPL